MSKFIRKTVLVGLRLPARLAPYFLGSHEKFVADARKIDDPKDTVIPVKPPLIEYQVQWRKSDL